MDELTKLNLKIQALRETYVNRVNELDDLVANYRVQITELSQTLQTTKQEFETYKQQHPEESDVQEEAEVPSPQE